MSEDRKPEEFQRWSDAIEGGTVLWDREMGGSYETNAHALLLMPNGDCFYVWASGCSCWEGETFRENMGSLAQALGPMGIPENVRDEAFAALVSSSDPDLLPNPMKHRHPGRGFRDGS